MTIANASYADRVREIATTSGTGTITLAGTALGYSSFATAFPAASTLVYYCIASPSVGTWEVGIGTYTLSGNTLSRTTVLRSSNANSLVSFGVEQKDVFVTMPADKMLGFSSFTATASPPANPSIGDVWLDPADGTVYTWYNDGTSSMWVDLEASSFVTSRAAIPTYISNAQPSDQGQYIWIQTGLGTSGSDFTMWFNI